MEAVLESPLQICCDVNQQADSVMANIHTKIKKAFVATNNKVAL